MRYAARTISRLWLVSFLALVLVGCPSLRPTPLVGVGQGATAVQSLSDTSVQGRVDFAGRSTQATPADVVNAATVSFLDTGTNQTVATGKTDAAGSFSLTLGSYTPVNGGTYLLEAVKGLNSQAPGSDAARFRTILRWNGTGWQSCTNSAVPGTIVINALTTALAIETALDAANVPAANTIGKVNVSTTPATLNANPGPYTNHPDSEITQLAADLLSYLGADTDPLASVPAISPSIASFQPTSAGANALVRIVGSGFSPVPSGNTVTFNGVSAQVLLATPTSLVVVVPSGAATGTLRVVTGRGSVNSGSPFTVGTAGASGLAITGFSPTYGRADTVVMLGGSFGTGTATPTVTFEGLSGLPVAASVTAWSATGMTVVVPLGAMPGAISVQSGSSTATAAGTFDVRQGDVGWMSNLTPTGSQSITPYTLPQPSHGHGAATWGTPPRYHYLTGGWNGTTAVPDVWMFPVNSDGSLGYPSRVGRLAEKNYHNTAVIVGNYVYVFGGHNDTTYINTIQRAAINPADGSLSPFLTIGTLANPRHDAEAVVIGTTIYVLGGNSPAERSDYERFTVDTSNGNLTAQPVGTMTVGGVPVTLRGGGVVNVNGRIVAVSGYLNSTYSVKSITFPILGDGSIGNGTYNATDLNQGYYGGALALINDELYMFSGYGTAYHTAVAHAPVNPATGVVGAWVYDSPSQLFPATYTSFPLVVGTRIYTFGGYANVGTGAATLGPASVIQTATVKADKSLSNWSLLGGVGLARHGFTGQVIGNKAWLVGGHCYNAGGLQRSTEYMAIRDDGSLGSPVPGPLLSVGRHAGKSFSVNGYFYVVGGESGGSVERAQIQPDGTLGPFVTLSSRLVQPRNWFGLVQTGRYVYAFGGNSYSGVYQSTVEQAELFPDGTLGPFRQYGVHLPGIMYAGSAAAVGNYVFVQQGWYPNTTSAEVWMARIAADGNLGQFTKAPAMTTHLYTGAFAQIGNYLYNFGGQGSGSGTLSTVQRAKFKSDGTLEAWQNVQPGGRDLMPVVNSHWGTAPYVYKDSVYLFSGYNGTLNPEWGTQQNVPWIFQGTIH